MTSFKKMFSLFFIHALLITPLIFSHTGTEILGRHWAKNCMLNDLLNRIEYENHEINLMEKYELIDERYYFYKAANDFHMKYYSLVFHDNLLNNPE